MMNENNNTQNQNSIVPRSPGGQPGNQNARIHGFYSRALTPAQQEQLKAAEDLRGVDQEIAMLRVKILSILDNDPENTAVLLRAVTALTRLLKVKAVCSGSDEKERAMQSLLNAVGNSGWGLSAIPTDAPDVSMSRTAPDDPLRRNGSTPVSCAAEESRSAQK